MWLQLTKQIKQVRSILRSWSSGTDNNPMTGSDLHFLQSIHLKIKFACTVLTDQITVTLYSELNQQQYLRQTASFG